VRVVAGSSVVHDTIAESRRGDTTTSPMTGGVRSVISRK
jgi:hypothetical protein